MPSKVLAILQLVKMKSSLSSTHRVMLQLVNLQYGKYHPCVYKPEDIGPALQQLRLKKRISQQDVADRMKVSRSTPSRYEQADSNPRLENLLRYLNAIGATFSDLDAEIQGDPVSDLVRVVKQRVADEPAYANSMADKLRRFGVGKSPEIRELVQLVLEQEERLARLEARPEAGELLSNGTED